MTVMRALVVSLLAAGLVAAAVLARPQSDDLRRLVDGWRSEDPVVRDRASDTLLSRWKEWSAADLDLLRILQRDGDSETKSRARDVLPRVELRRQLGPRMASKAETLEGLIPFLRRPEGRIVMQGFINPGGPIFSLTPPLKEVIALGRDVEPLLRPKLKDPTIRSEVAMALSELGDENTLPALIAELPQKEDPHTFWVLYALWQITGIELGIHHKWTPEYNPTFKTQWAAWYEDFKEFLYRPARPRKTDYSWANDLLQVDMEARIVGVPTRVYRREHPWITFDSVKTWQEGEAYERKLKDFCISTIIENIWSHGGLHRDAVRCLGPLRDPRALGALHHLVRSAKTPEDADRLYDVLWTLDDRGDLSTLPLLEKLPVPSDKSTASLRESCLQRHRLLQKHGPAPKETRLDPWEETLYLGCLDDPAAVDLLLEQMANAKPHQTSSVDVAGWIRQPRVLDALRTLARKDGTPAKMRIRAFVALARHKEVGAVEWLRERLRQPEPALRLAAARGLWDLRRKDGRDALLELLKLRPLETGAEGVRSGEGILKVESIDDTRAEIVRGACELLGDMREAAAIPLLRALLKENLNGVSGSPQEHGGFGYYGRPDVVALSRLGDDSGIEVLRASIRNGDPLDVVGGWGHVGDYVLIGRKRHIPDLLPMLDHRVEEKRVRSAASILRLLEVGE